MWAPVDITAIPTAKDLTDAKYAIEQVEIKLKDALLLLEQTQLRVANIEKDLQERRAWIAPIRRLSFDVLSPIFEFCGEDNWGTPLRIAGVSRKWRTLVLSTPRAWAFPEVHELGENKEALEQFFTHSGQRPLHVLLSESQRLAILHEVAKRLKCLSVFEFSQLDEIPVFPKLEHLSLRYVSGAIGLSDLHVGRFPALRELVCESSIIGAELLWPNSITVTPPPLQVLSVAIEADTGWLELLMGCQSNLVSLRLHFVDEYPHPMPQIFLPMLRCLEIYFWQFYPDIWPMDMRTPVLETYIERRECSVPPAARSPVHEDAGTVTQVRIAHGFNLSTMTLLRLIQLETEVDIAGVLSQLQADRSLCTRLEIVEVMGEDLSPYEASLVGVNEGQSQPISIRNAKFWAMALPYQILRSPVSNRSGTYIPTEVSFSVDQTCHAAEMAFFCRDNLRSHSTVRSTFATSLHSCWK